MHPPRKQQKVIDRLKLVSEDSRLHSADNGSQILAAVPVLVIVERLEQFSLAGYRQRVGGFRLLLNIVQLAHSMLSAS